MSQNRPHDSFDPGRSGEFPRSVDESTYAASLPLVRYGTTAIRAMSSMRPGAIYRALSALLTVEGAPVLAVVVGLLMARFGPGAGLHEISLTALVPPTVVTLIGPVGASIGSRRDRLPVLVPMPEERPVSVIVVAPRLTLVSPSAKPLPESVSPLSP